MLTEATDEALVVSAQQGEKEAFAVLVDRWGDRSYNLALRILKNADDAEEVVQEAFLNAYRSLDRFKHGSTFGTWLYRIVTNTALVKMRKSTREVFLDGPDNGNGKRKIPEGLIDWTESPLDDLINQETRELMDEAVGSLPLDQRTVFVLRDIDELPATQVGEILGLSVPAVKSRLHRARLQLRDRLGDYFKEKSAAREGSD